MIAESLIAAAVAISPLHDTNKEVKCLASAIYHEARGESHPGQVQVAHVVINRKNSGKYPNKICAVVFQPKQFSGLYKIRYDTQSYHVAKKVYTGVYKPPLWNVTHYHTTSVNPHWASWSKLTKVGKIGNHVFYRFKG